MEANKKKILVVDDEQDLCEILKFNLETEGYQADTANSGEEAMSMDIASYDLLLLDVMMGGMSGFQLAKQLKENPMTAHVPIIFLTARDTENDTVTGFNLGADDYIAKPFGIMELVARVKALLRRTEGSKKEREYNIGSLFVNIDKHIVKVEGEEISLTLKEFELLSLLLENRNIVLTRDKILETIWGYNFDGETRTVDVHIRTLRAKLKAAGNLINTVRGIGYKID